MKKIISFLLGTFVALNLFVSVATTAGVLFVTASIGAELVNYNNTFHLSFFILVACLVILSQGSYDGLDIIMKLKLVSRLSKYSKIFISSEIPLPGNLEKYRIN